MTFREWCYEQSCNYRVTFGSLLAPQNEYERAVDVSCVWLEALAYAARNGPGDEDKAREILREHNIVIPEGI